MTFRPWLVLTAALPLVVLSACTDRVQQQPGCLSDDDCLRPRMCVDGACFDPNRVDVGMSDAADGSGGTAADAGSDGPDSGSGSDATADAGGGAELDGFGPVPDVPPGRACLEARPTRIDLGDVVLGDRVVRSALFENCGRLPVTLERVEFFDPDNLVSALDVPFVPVTLEPGDSEPVIFAIEPVAEGPFAAQVEVSWAEGEPVFVSVEGEAIESPEAGCISIDRLTSLGQVRSAEGITRGSFVVRNCGSTSLEDIQLESGLPGLTFTEPAPFTLGPGEQAEVPVQVVLNQLGAFLSTVLVTSGTNAALGFVTIDVVNETTSQGCLVATPESTFLGEAPIGTTLSTTVRLNNCGDRPVEARLSQVAALSSNQSEYDATGGPFTIESRESQDLEVSLTLLAEGEQSFLFAYVPDVGSLPAVFEVSATGVRGPSPAP